MLDTRSIGVAPGEAPDRGVMHLQLADSADQPVGDWMKLEPIRNVYDQQGTDGYTNCLFDPVDDGNTEDDFFDPEDPERRLGPSSMCYPAFSWTRLGDTFLPFDEENIALASDGPGLEGVGIGTWVESEFSLRRFIGRRARFRFVVAGIKLGSQTTFEAAFAPLNPDPGDDGWWIDDIRITDTLAIPAVVQPDLKDNTGLSTCAVTCSEIVPVLAAEPPATDAPGQPVTLDASASQANRCENGVLQYRFWIDRDENGNGGDPTDRLLRGWSDISTYLDAPGAHTSYVAEIRCSALTTCRGTAGLSYFVGCPSSGALGGVFQTVVATNSAFQWSEPADIRFAYGSLAAVDQWDTSGGGNGALADANAFDTAAIAPAAGDGYWFLFRSAGIGGTRCNDIATWTSGGANETPGRDTALP